MKSIFLLLCLLLLVPFPIPAGEQYLDVTAPGNRPQKLAIAYPAALAGSRDTAVERELADVFSFDLTLSGPFDARFPQVAPYTEGITPGSFAMAYWQQAGYDLLLKTGYSFAGGKLTIECHLYEVANGAELAAKRFTGSRGELRRMAHLFSDEIMRVMTGTAGPFSGKILFVSARTGNKEIYLMDYDGYNVQRLTGNGAINLSPAFSPSGKEIVYTSYKKGNPDLYRRELYTGAEALISRRHGLNIGGSWSPDGKRIALAMSVHGTPQIYVLDKDGQLLARLTHEGAIDISPSWSPDGSRLVFVSDREGGPQLFVMDADGRNAHRITFSGNYNVSPSWSPKGDRIVYSRREHGGFQVYTINPNGSNDTRLTTEGRNEHPRWSPDGRYITFSSTRDGREAIYVMRGDGTDQVAVSRSKGADSQPSWMGW
ncbi:MAG TPA: Tol-Pal system beta propeller repeat protein TolB [Geobacteraceae bacterium]|nr:Tol-Pal system beta propeller repeat protein TolB [Geobacteraceae bacterium]